VANRTSIPRNLGSALPLLALSAVYFAAWRDGWLPPGMTYRSMAQILQLEFLALHAGAFLGLLVTWQPAERAARRTRWILFVLLLVPYMALAIRHGWEGALGFLALLLGTYLGWMLNREPEQAKIGLFLRWGTMLLLMVVLAHAVGMPKNVERWANSYTAYPLGAWYFLGLGLLEAIGFYQMPVWAKFLAAAHRQRR
jgi:hypothetical protein